MQYRRLGRSGLRVSRICLGMMSFGPSPERPWHLDEAAAEPIVRRAVEAGVTFFDTADMYSGGESERITGRLLAKLFPAREDYVLATKVYYPTGPGPNVQDTGLPCPATSAVSLPSGPRRAAPPGEPTGVPVPGRGSLKNRALSAVKIDHCVGTSSS